MLGKNTFLFHLCILHFFTYFDVFIINIDTIIIGAYDDELNKCTLRKHQPNYYYFVLHNKSELLLFRRVSFSIKLFTVERFSIQLIFQLHRTSKPAARRFELFVLAVFVRSVGRT